MVSQVAESKRQNGSRQLHREPEKLAGDGHVVIGQSDADAPVAPDGGWGWVVVFASFMVHVITDGVTYSYGLFHIEFVRYFGSSEQATSWITSLLVGITYCSGPFSSFLVNKYGCRAVTIAGTILASACLFVSVWAPDVVMLYFTAGIGTGLGFGLIYLPAIVSVTIYFEKYRSLATGIAVCGSGLGTVIFAEVISQLMTYYGGYKYPMMILSAIILNCIIFGLMFKPLEPTPKTVESIPLKEVQKNGGLNSLPEAQAKQVDGSRRSSSCHVVAKKSLMSKTPDSGRTTDSTSVDAVASNNIRLALSQPMLSSKDANNQSPGEAFPRVSCINGVMNRSDVFLRSSIYNIRKRSESLTNSSYEENTRFRLSLRSLPNGSGIAHNHGHKIMAYPTESAGSACADEELVNDNIIKRMLQFSLLKDPLFIIFTISNFCTSIGFNVPYVYLVGQAMKKGVLEHDASRLLAVIGLSNAVGRVVLGYVSDKPWINRLIVYNLCLTICGLATALNPLCNSFGTFAMYAAVYGFTAGAYVGLTSVCLVDLVGLDRLTNAFGLVLLAQGIASFLGPPIAGLLTDMLHSYDPGFMVAGGMIAISGLMLFVIPPIQRRKLKREAELQMNVPPHF